MTRPPVKFDVFCGTVVPFLTHEMHFTGEGGVIPLNGKMFVIIK